MHSLPSVKNIAAFHAWRGDAAQWLPVALDIARGHALACTTPHVFTTGTNLVVGLDGPFILKIFPPLLRAQFAPSVLRCRG
jgi:hygromycin-B 7''-O-kinase